MNEDTYQRCCAGERCDTTYGPGRSFLVGNDDIRSWPCGCYGHKDCQKVGLPCEKHGAVSEQQKPRWRMVKDDPDASRMGWVLIESESDSYALPIDRPIRRSNGVPSHIDSKQGQRLLGTLNALEARIRDLEHFRRAIEETPWGQCYTLPDGQCIGRGCMHDVAYYDLEQRNAVLKAVLRKIVDNEARLEAQVGIHSAIRAKKSALAQARAMLTPDTGKEASDA